MLQLETDTEENNAPPPKKKKSMKTYFIKHIFYKISAYFFLTLSLPFWTNLSFLVNTEILTVPGQIDTS